MKKLKKEETADDYCFVCKDGGELRICDYGDCLKCYHPKCENKEESFLDSKEHWTCRWHQCSLCHRPAKFQCYTCPMAVCGLDLYYSEFAQVKGQKGFCGDCLLLAYLVEKNKDVVSEEGVKVDFEEEGTGECWFREYYEIVKEKECLTAQMTLSAMEAYKKGKKITSDPDNEDVYQSDDEELVSDYDDIGDEVVVLPLTVKKKRKRPSGRTKKSVKANTTIFFGWGSKSLIVFLNSIGEDTTEPLSQCDVDSIIRRYIHSKKLVKKKTVSCDEKLQSLFRRKSVNIHRISGLLESHFAENVKLLDHEDDINATSSAYEDDNSSMQPCHSKKQVICNKKFPKSETPSTKRSCYAVIVAENIKLIYMRRTLVEKLLEEQPETAKDKLIGSFVRVKSDPYDCMQKNSYQIVKVMGANGSSGQPIFSLQVSNQRKYITISDISEEDFTVEECDELRQRVEAGLLSRITVVDLEQKAQLLHEDITKHGITRRLAILQNLIDRANEKGWRRELFEYLEEKELLQTKAEQSRLLQEFPTVIAEEIIDRPSIAPGSNRKQESEYPQQMGRESSSLVNDPESPVAKSSIVLEGNEWQPKDRMSKKLQDFSNPIVLHPTLSVANTYSTAYIPLVLGLRSISEPAIAENSLSTVNTSPVLGLRANSEPVIKDVSSLSTANFSHVLGLKANSEPAIKDASSLSTVNILPVLDLRANFEPDVENTSSPLTSECQVTNIFLNCLKLDFPSLFASNNQISFLRSLTTLSEVGDFSLKQIDAIENFIYEFPRLTSDYQFAEDTTLSFQQYMKFHSSQLEDAKQYMVERENVEAQEKSAHESSLKIQEEIRQLQQKLKAINSKEKTLSSRKLALDAKIKDTNAKLAKSGVDFDKWKTRQREAIKQQEIVHAAWESFRNQFTNINEATMVSELPSAEVIHQQIPNTLKEAVHDGKNKPSLIAAGEAHPKVKSEAREDDVYSNTLSPWTFSHQAAQNLVHSWLEKPDAPENSPFTYFP